MVAKLIVWASDRDAAIARLERALSELSVEGIRTNAPLFRQILRDADFRAGRIDVGTLDRKLASGEWASAEDSQDEDLAMIAAAVAHAERLRRTSPKPAPGGAPPAGRRSHWREAARREALGNRSWS